MIFAQFFSSIWHVIIFSTWASFLRFSTRRLSKMSVGVLVTSMLKRLAPAIRVRQCWKRFSTLNLDNVLELIWISGILAWFYKRKASNTAKSSVPWAYHGMWPCLPWQKACFDTFLFLIVNPKTKRMATCNSLASLELKLPAKSSTPIQPSLSHLSLLCLLMRGSLKVLLACRCKSLSR